MRRRRTKLERRLDLEEAALRRLGGESYEEIARALGVSASQIFRDLQTKEAEWLQSAHEDFAVLRSKGTRQAAKARGQLLARLAGFQGAARGFLGSLLRRTYSPHHHRY